MQSLIILSDGHRVIPIFEILIPSLPHELCIFHGIHANEEGGKKNINQTKALIYETLLSLKSTQIFTLVFASLKRRTKKPTFFIVGIVKCTSGESLIFAVDAPTSHLCCNEPDVPLRCFFPSFLPQVLSLLIKIPNDLNVCTHTKCRGQYQREQTESVCLGNT